MPKTKARPPLGGGTRKANAEEWASVEAAKDPDDLPRLVAAIREAQSPTATLHIAALSTRTNDARLVDALLSFITEPPYQGGQSKKFYSAVITGLGGTKSAAARDAMLALSKRYKTIMKSFLGDYITSRLATTATRMTVAGAKSAAKSATSGAKPPAKRSSFDELFAEIVAAPRDDGPRIVFADALSETAKGKLRGELITLQLARSAGHATRKQAERERELINEHELLDKLAPPLSAAAYAVTFERGFPVAVYLQKTGLARIVDEPAWGTIEKLSWYNVPLGPVVKLIDGGHVPNLTTVGRIDAALLGKLKAATYAWTDIELDHVGVAGDALARFPSLRRLRLTSKQPLPAGTLADAQNVELLDVSGAVSASVLVPLDKLRELRLHADVEPAVAGQLALERVVIHAPLARATAWLAAAPTLTSLEVHDDEAFREDIAWAAVLEQLHATSLRELVIARFRGIMRARFVRAGDGWHLEWPVADRWVGFYEELAKLAQPLRAAGVTAMTLYPEEPLHYSAPFSDAKRGQIAAIDAAWQPIVVAKPDAFRWPDGEAPRDQRSCRAN